MKLVPAWHTADLAERHRAHAGRPADRLRRHDDLPRRRHVPLLRPAARRPRATRSTSRSCRSAATTRWTATTRSRRCELIGAKTVDPVPLRHVPADRDRRAGVQGGRRGADVERRGRAGAGRELVAMTHAIVLIQAERTRAAGARRAARRHPGRRRGVLDHRRVGLRGDPAAARAGRPRARRSPSSSRSCPAS